MQEFFHNFAVIFFLFVTALKSAFLCICSEKVREKGKTLTFFRRLLKITGPGGTREREKLLQVESLPRPLCLL